MEDELIEVCLSGSPYQVFINKVPKPGTNERDDIQHELALEEQRKAWLVELEEQMIPYQNTLNAFHAEEMQHKWISSLLSTDYFKTGCDDLPATILDIDNLFPDTYFYEDNYNSVAQLHNANEGTTPMQLCEDDNHNASSIVEVETKMNYGLTAEDFTPLKKYLYQNCKWTGCDEECAKTHSADIPSEPFTDICLEFPNVIIPSLLFGEENSSDGEMITEAPTIQPYTPDSDHCYSQPMHLRVVSEEIDRTVQDSVDSESASESSDDEVDVVTVTEECVRPVIQRYVEPIKISRQRYTQRKAAARSRVSAASMVKAAASALKRTRFNGRMPSNRRRVLNSVETSPSSSLPSSAVSSRCNSDIEDCEKRSTHNDSERKRREAQRTALQMLRVCIPELQGNAKAPKVLILNTAARLVKRLKTEKNTQKEQKKMERKRRKMLLERLNALMKK